MAKMNLNRYCAFNLARAVSNDHENAYLRNFLLDKSKVCVLYYFMMFLEIFHLYLNNCKISEKSYFNTICAEDIKIFSRTFFDSTWL